MSEWVQCGWVAGAVVTCALDIGALVRPQLRHVRRRVHLAHGEWLLNNLEALNNRFGRRLLASIG